MFDRVAHSGRLATEEFMGPIMAIAEAADVDQTFEVANASPYGLNGAYFSRNEDHLRTAADRLHVCNL